MAFAISCLVFNKKFLVIMTSVFIHPEIDRTLPDLARAAKQASGREVVVSKKVEGASAVVFPSNGNALKMPLSENCSKIAVSFDNKAGSISIDSSGDRVNAHISVPYRETTYTQAIILSLLRGQCIPAGESPCFSEALRLAERVALSDVTVMISGPTGTGKEVLSRFIHETSSRAKGPMLAVNCAAVPETMLEAILFGHERGSFTGAGSNSKGIFRAADGGSLLLDEIAEVPIGLQAKLLRALQEREILPIGATKPIAVDVRVIATANRDMKREVAEGRFREDLFYRLNVFPLSLPSLSERKEDLPSIAAALLLKHAPANSPWLAESALIALSEHSWAGNVRELENVLQRALVIGNGECIEDKHLLFDPTDETDKTSAGQITLLSEGETLGEYMRRQEFEAIRIILGTCNGIKSAAARRLGISERALRYKLAEMKTLETTNVYEGA